MTQALINNMNNINQEYGLSQCGNSQKNAPIDFGKILNDKTDKINTQNTDKISNPIDIKNKINKETTDTTDTSAQKKSNNSISGEKRDLLSDEYNNAVKEGLAEAIVDLTVSEDIFINTDAEAQNSTEEIITDETTTTDTNITKEEPTMNEDLTALTNPTVAILIHSNQIFGNPKTVDNGENSNELGESGISSNFNNNARTTQDNADIFKQFDNTSSKEASIPNLPDKSNIDLKDNKSTINKFIDKEIIKELNVEVLSQNAEEEGANSGDIMQNQTPQEQAAKVMIQGDVKYESIAKEAIKPTEVKHTEITPSKIIEQISKQLENLHSNSRLNIVLNPGTLGKVNIQIMNGKEGLTAQFTATTQDARDLLLKGLDGLKESLLAQGISIDDVSVKLEEAESEYQQDWTEQEGSRGGNKHQEARKQKEGEKTFEELFRDSADNLKDS